MPLGIRDLMGSGVTAELPARPVHVRKVTCSMLDPGNNTRGYERLLRLRTGAETAG